MQTMRMRDYYQQEVIPKLRERFGYSNVMMVPKVTKVVVNMGVGDGAREEKLIEAACVELAAISGQAPIVTRAKKSISNFKLRAGMQVGVKVTLRRSRMYDFLERLFNIAIPRVRDFRGLSERSFDGRGNYTFGVREQIVFPEINYDKVVRIQGMDITICTSAETDEEAQELLSLLGMPLRRG